MGETSQMTNSKMDRIARVLDAHHADLLDEWMEAQSSIPSARGNSSSADLRRESREFLSLLRRAAGSGDANTDGAAWGDVRNFLNELSRTRAQQGASPAETATFVFSFKEPFFTRLWHEPGSQGDAAMADVWSATRLLDELGLYTMESFQRRREEVIQRQQQDMLELSTPVVSLWDGILALPMIGTLDSARTLVVMETLLQRIVETGADIAIIDITGVPTVDTLTAQHLLKTVTAARLMGAECIISGIRPQIAQTIVHLGVDLGDVLTKASLAQAFRLALQRTGRTIVRTGAAASPANGKTTQA